MPTVTAPRLRGFKAAVFCLLVANTAFFAARGTLSEALDSVAWFTLLLLFELETAHRALIAGPRTLKAIHAVRWAAGIAVLAAALGYVHDRAWLDALNAWLWIAVVVLLEVEVRFEEAVARHRRLFGAAAAALYLSLAAIVLAWAWRGETFDAYDAALWLIAFATIELNILAGSNRGESLAQARAGR